MKAHENDYDNRLTGPKELKEGENAPAME